MIVWGGYGHPWQYSYFNTGGLYNPSTDSWDPTSMEGNVPLQRAYHTAVWTGTKMIIWGGLNGTYLSSGGIYRPESEHERPLEKP